MKKLTKIFVNLLAVLMLSFACISLTACEDIKKLKVTVEVYDYEAKEAVEQTFNINLYRHLAPNTVDSVIANVKEGYYNDCLLYISDDWNAQIMFGDYKMQGENVVFNTVKPQIKGEFTKGGTTQGSNLINAKGYVGLWHSWLAIDNEGEAGYTATNSAHTGRTTIYMPTKTISAYNGYFCVFGEYDIADEDIQELFDLISEALTNSENYTLYTVYYKGEYDKAKADTNYGLTGYCVKSEDFTEEDVFEAEFGQLVEYNKHEIRISNQTVKIKSVTVK